MSTEDPLRIQGTNIGMLRDGTVWERTEAGWVRLQWERNIDTGEYRNLQRMSDTEIIPLG